MNLFESQTPIYNPSGQHPYSFLLPLFLDKQGKYHSHSPKMSAEDEQQLSFNHNEDHENESYSPSLLKRIALALTLAFFLFTMLPSPPPLPLSQAMKLFKGGLEDEQMLQGRDIEGSSWRREKRMQGSSRRVSAALGSHPPSCVSKCGRCVPCKPVRVPIHPGRNRPEEYYPEAWRCKCGNKLYMP